MVSPKTNTRLGKTSPSYSVAVVSGSSATLSCIARGAMWSQLFADEGGPAKPAGQRRKRAKRPLALAAKRRGQEQLDDLVGSVLESDKGHRGRHGGTPEEETCPRCHWIARKSEFGKHAPWCVPRPAFLGGHWRLGCKCCQWMHAARPKEGHQNTRRGSAMRSCSFAKFEFARTARCFDFFIL